MISESRQPKWDLFEAAFLLEAVLKVEAGQEKKRDAIKRVSSALRAIAINKGLAVNKTYRNENGIAFQFQSMEFSMFGRMSATHKTGSKLFDEAVALYRTDVNEYKNILTTAHSLATPKTTSDITQHNIINQSCTKNAFKVWLIAEGNKEKRRIGLLSPLSLYQNTH